MASTPLSQDTSQSDNNASRFSMLFTTHYASQRAAFDPYNGVADAKQAKMDGGASSQETGQVRLVASAAQTPKPPTQGEATSGAGDATSKTPQEGNATGGTADQTTKPPQTGSSLYKAWESSIPALREQQEKFDKAMAKIRDGVMDHHVSLLSRQADEAGQEAMKAQRKAEMLQQKVDKMEQIFSGAKNAHENPDLEDAAWSAAASLTGLGFGWLVGGPFGAAAGAVAGPYIREGYKIYRYPDSLYNKKNLDIQQQQINDFTGEPLR